MNEPLLRLVLCFVTSTTMDFALANFFFTFTLFTLSVVTTNWFVPFNIILFNIVFRSEFNRSQKSQRLIKSKSLQVNFIIFSIGKQYSNNFVIYRFEFYFASNCIQINLFISLLFLLNSIDCGC